MLSPTGILWPSSQRSRLKRSASLPVVCIALKPGRPPRVVTPCSQPATTLGFALSQASAATSGDRWPSRSEEHTSELQSHVKLVCRLLLEKKNHGGPVEYPRHGHAR